MSRMVIADGGRSGYTIVVPEDAIPSEIHAAEELKFFIREISGVELPIGREGQIKPGPGEIILGRSSHLDRLNLGIDWGKLGPEGFVIRSVNGSLVIAGGRPRGTLYGVYSFLEDHLGCRWFSPGVDRTPKLERVEVGPVDESYIPPLEYREPFYTSAFDGDWAARNRMNSSAARLEEKHGGKITYSHFVHTFEHILPAEKFFDEHPEYFSEIDGKRVKDHTQLCLTNPDVLRITIEKVREWIGEAPDAQIYSVSQNDWRNWCRCPSCSEVDRREGSPSGSLLEFVNKVADAIGRDYPDKAIDTLAYQYTRRPPRTIRPRKNVIVRLCSIECCFSHPLDECEENVSFADDIRGWSEISDRLYVWDYVTDFAHYIMPFPNFDVLKPNIQFFIRNGVKGIFEEGNYSPGGKGEFAELRAYVLAKLLWNPDYDAELAKDEFLEGYYGAAAGPLGEYIDLIHRKVRDEHIHINIGAPPTSPYLSPDVIGKADELFDEAEDLVEGEQLERVLVARLPLEYVKISTLPDSDPEKGEIVRRFFEVAERAGITHISEGKTLESYKREIMGA